MRWIVALTLAASGGGLLVARPSLDLPPATAVERASAERPPDAPALRGRSAETADAGNSETKGEPVLVGPRPCGEPMPDPVEVGPHRLVLTLVDDVTGERVNSRFCLWRIDAPANVDWTAGDQRQSSDTTHEGSAVLEGLPAGRYRAHVHGQRVGSEDAQPFVVNPVRVETAVTLAVAWPRSHPVRLRVTDRAGRLVREGAIVRKGSGSTGSGPATPQWVRRRRPTTGPYPCTVGMGCTGCGVGGRSAPVPLAFDGDAFVLCHAREPERYSRTTHSYTVRCGPDLTDVSVFVADVLAPTTYVAVAVSLEDLADTVRLPDGRTVRQAGATLVAEVRAHRLDESGEPVLEDDAPPGAHRAYVSVPGHESESFWLAPRDHLPEIALRLRDR